MKKYSLRQIAAACLLTALATACAAGLLIYAAAGGREGLSFFSKLNTVRRIAQTGFVGDIDWEHDADSAAAGIVAGLDDRWSYYMTAEEYESYQQRTENTSTGLGIVVEKSESGGFRIVSVYDGSPAAAAGLRTGQSIVAAAGKDVRGLDMDSFRSLVASQEGEFELELLNSDGSSETVRLSRGSFYSSPVSYELLENGIGYIRIANFEQGAAENAVQAIQALTEQGMKKLIFDVRSNPGGLLSELIELLDYILPEGDLFISVGKDGEEKIYRSDAEHIEMDMAVLINENSYSAAEFFAAALSEYGYAVTVGSPSTGKGRSQVTYELSDGSAVHISTRRYLTPNRVDLSQQGGLTPDINIAQSTQGDAQLQEAIICLS